jgi:hypothetical protein
VSPSIRGRGRLLWSRFIVFVPNHAIIEMPGVIRAVGQGFIRFRKRSVGDKMG